jgi:hypothetical protein
MVRTRQRFTLLQRWWIRLVPLFGKQSAFTDVLWTAIRPSGVSVVNAGTTELTTSVYLIARWSALRRYSETVLTTELDSLRSAERLLTCRWPLLGPLRSL